jgi:hypothetical protein
LQEFELKAKYTRSSAEEAEAESSQLKDLLSSKEVLALNHQVTDLRHREHWSCGEVTNAIAGQGFVHPSRGVAIRRSLTTQGVEMPTNKSFHHPLHKHYLHWQQLLPGEFVHLQNLAEIPPNRVIKRSLYTNE